MHVSGYHAPIAMAHHSTEFARDRVQLVGTPMPRRQMQETSDPVEEASLLEQESETRPDRSYAQNLNYKSKYDVATPGFEMCFAIGFRHLRCWRPSTILESSIKRFKPHFIYFVGFTSGTRN